MGNLPGCCVIICGRTDGMERDRDTYFVNGKKLLYILYDKLPKV